MKENCLDSAYQHFNNSLTLHYHVHTLLIAIVIAKLKTGVKVP